MGIGERIKELRVKAELTLEELGEACGISKGSLSEIENGADLRASTLERIARALGVEPAVLHGGVHGRPRPAASARTASK